MVTHKLGWIVYIVPVTLLRWSHCCLWGSKLYFWQMCVMDQFCLVIILIEERESASWFPSLVVPIDNLPFVFFRIVVGGQWALLTPQPGRLLNVIQPWPLSAAASFLFGYICIWDASASAISKGRQWQWQWQWAMQGRRKILVRATHWWYNQQCNAKPKCFNRTEDTPSPIGILKF